MEKFLSIILCFTFLVLPINIRAEETPSDADIQNMIDQQTGEDPLARSKPKQGEEQSFFNRDCSNCGGYDFYIKQIFTLGLSVIGSTLITQCYAAATIPSTIVFLVGTLGHIVSEIGWGSALSDRNKARLEDLKITETLDTKGSQVQEKAFKDALEEEKELRDFIEVKKIFTMAIGVVYLIAMGLAIFEATVDASSLGIAASWTVGKCNPIAIPQHEIASRIVNTLIVGVFTALVSAGHAGNINSYGGALLTLLGLFQVPIIDAISPAFQTAVGRSITFGVFTGFQAPLIYGYFERATIADSNIEKLKKVIRQFEVTTQDDDGGVNTDMIPTIIDDPNRDKKLKALATQTKFKNVCAGNSSKACGTTIRKFDKPKFEFGDLGVLQDGANKAVDMTNALVDGNIESAKATAGSLSSMAGRIRKVNEELKKKLNEKLKAEGKPPIDFDKEIQKRSAQYQQFFNNALEKSNMAPLQQNAFAPTSLPVDDKSREEIKVVASGASPAPQAQPNPFDLFGDEEGTPAEAAGAIAKTGQGIDQFDTNEADISKKSDVSIFVQLSNRYILNYNRIFQKASAQDKSEEKAPLKDKSATK